MNRHEHLMNIVREECDELSQRVSKAMRFGLRQVQEDAGDSPEQNPDRLDNQMRIDLEFHDLLAAMEMAGLVTIEQPTDERDGLPGVPFIRVAPTLIAAKQAKVERYLERSRRCGTLTECSRCGGTGYDQDSKSGSLCPEGCKPAPEIGYEACWLTVEGKQGRCRMPKGHEGDCAPF